MAIASKTDEEGVGAPGHAADEPNKTPDAAAGTTSATPGTHPRAVADRVTRHNSTQIHLPLLGAVKLPATDELAFLGGVGVLAAVGVIEWPVAGVLVAGHALATSHRNKVVREFGEALECA